MKVRIKKGKKTKEYNVINSWEEVTLEKWLEIISLEKATKPKQALGTINSLSNIPKKLIKELSVGDVAIIMARIAELQKESKSKLSKIIEIEGVEYGFHPDLEELTLGEYADLETYISKGIEKYLPEIMAILYRPVIEKTDKGMYSIQAYDGKLRLRKHTMKKMSAQQVHTALVFFWNIVEVLSKIMPSYLMERMEEMKTQ